jgi:hypothetical protein
MRADVIEVFAPGVQYALRHDRRAEDVRAFKHSSRSRPLKLNEGVLHGLARRDELEAHVVRMRARPSHG